MPRSDSHNTPEQELKYHVLDHVGWIALSLNNLAIEAGNTYHRVMKLENLLVAASARLSNALYGPVLVQNLMEEWEIIFSAMGFISHITEKQRAPTNTFI